MLSILRAAIAASSFVFQRGRNQGELVPAEARDRVAVAHHRAQRGSDLLQEPVADIVTERIVDALEAIQVDEQNRKESPLAPAGGDVDAQTVEEQRAIGNAGEAVEVRQLLEPFLGAVPLRELLPQLVVRELERPVRPLDLAFHLSSLRVLGNQQLDNLLAAAQQRVADESRHARGEAREGDMHAFFRCRGRHQLFQLRKADDHHEHQHADDQGVAPRAGTVRRPRDRRRQRPLLKRSASRSAQRADGAKHKLRARTLVREKRARRHFRFYARAVQPQPVGENRRSLLARGGGPRQFPEGGALVSRVVNS